MKVLFVTSEAAPFVKSGGLGEVAAGLPKALASKKVAARVMMPLYGSVGEQWRSQMKFLKYIYVPLAWRNLYCGIFELRHDGVTYYFLDNEYYFKRSNLYGYFDDAERFAFFSRAVCEAIPELGWKPDVLHVNDWQTALVPVYQKTVYWSNPQIGGVKSLFTIHNIEYQGRYGKDTMVDVFGLPYHLFTDGTIEYKKDVNLLKGAVNMSDCVTTVSPTYASELKYAYYAKGLEGVIQANSHKLHGILNGIDLDVNNPETDKHLIKNYGVETRKDKLENKLELQKLLGFKQDPDIPLVASVSRLVAHKGFDLITSAFDSIMGLNLQYVLLGTGDWYYEQQFRNLQNRYPGKFSAQIFYSNEMARKIYAGADILLMPSQSEPCGLVQMIAMRYGTVPVVRETGGLYDTVSPYIFHTGEGRGFTFSDYNQNDMVFVLTQACETFKYKTAWDKIVECDMRSDFSWASSALEYKKLYASICGDYTESDEEFGEAAEAMAEKAAPAETAVAVGKEKPRKPKQRETAYKTLVDKVTAAVIEDEALKEDKEKSPRAEKVRLPAVKAEPVDAKKTAEKPEPAKTEKPVKKAETVKAEKPVEKPEPVKAEKPAGKPEPAKTEKSAGKPEPAKAEKPAEKLEPAKAEKLANTAPETKKERAKKNAPAEGKSTSAAGKRAPKAKKGK